MVFRELKAKHRREVIGHRIRFKQQDFACEVCTGKSGAKPEISRPYPRRFHSTVSQKQFRPPCQFCMLCVFIMCVHVDQNAPLQCGGGGCTGSNRVVTYFRCFSSGAHICNRVLPRSRSRPIFTDLAVNVCRFAAPATSLNTLATPPACSPCQSGISLPSLGRHF